MLSVKMQIIAEKYCQRPAVSVVIPSYNRAGTVRETINSIINQQCDFEFEIVIGDDCSTDNSREVLLDYQKKYPDKILLIFHDKNIGLGANWATCVKYCRGKYIANCDNDDYWHNVKKLQLQVDFLESHSETGVCHTDYRKHNRESGRIEEVKISDIVYREPTLQRSIFNGEFKCCNASVMYRKEIIDKHLNLDDYIKYHFTLQDWNTWMILSRYTDFYCLPVSTSTFGIETESITRPKDFQQLEERFRKERDCYKYICDLFPDDFPYDSSEYDEYTNSSLLNLAIEYNDFAKAKYYGGNIKSDTLKQFCSRNKLLFNLFRILRSIKKQIIVFL
jgi:glycosyltransferase involved in cell wall biosynthesis